MFSSSENKNEKQPLLPKSMKDTDVIVINRENNAFEHIAHDGTFARVPEEMILMIASYLSLQELANFLKTNKNLGRIAQDAVPVLNDKWKKRLAYHGDENLSYSLLHDRDRFNPTVLKMKRLEKLDNDVIDDKIFKKSGDCAYMLTTFLILTIGGAGTVAFSVVSSSLGLSDEVRLGGTIGGIGFSVVLGMGMGIFCCVRNRRIDKEKRQLTSEIDNALPKSSV